MFIIEVTPFSKSIRTSSLSYFSSAKIDLGSIVTVPLRNKNIKGLVIGIRDAKEMKTELRENSFTLKRVSGVSKNSLLSPAFIRAAEETAEYFATSTGSIIQSLVPNIIFEEGSKIAIKFEEKKHDDKTSPKYILQTEEKDRYSEYKSIIREKFAKNESIFFVVPTIEDAKIAEKKLTRGIEKHAHLLHNRMTKKFLANKLIEISKRDKPCLVIATPGFVGIPIKKIGMIIAERESSSAYKIMTRPYFDTKFFVEKYAEHLGADYLVGSLMLRTETLWRYDNHEFIEHNPIKFRSIADATQKIIDTSENKNVISLQMAEMIKNAIEDNEKTFILNTRKGLNPIIICGDCGQVVKCDRCDASMTLYGKDATKNDNYFRCRACGHERNAGEKCINCDSWNLRAYGFGTEKIKSELGEIFPKAKIFILDKDHAKTPKQIETIVKNFYESPNGILIGTEMALLYLNEEVENVAVASIDSMFSLPDFRIRERIMNVLLSARSKASQKFLIQTRDKDQEIFKNVIEGNLMDFYRNEFISRKKFDYPPFSLIIKISLAAKSDAQIEEQFNEIAKNFEPYELIIYPAFSEKIRGNKIVHGMIKIEREKWPNKDLVEKIKALPPQFKIEIDAESIL